MVDMTAVKMVALMVDLLEKHWVESKANQLVVMKDFRLVVL
jgi:hypothetical protein